MTPAQRLFDYASALEHPVTRVCLSVVVGLLVTVPLLVLALRRLGAIAPALSREVLVRTFSWWAIALIVIGPILLGAFWVMLVFFAISIIGYIEYSRITGLFRKPAVSWTVLLGIAAVYFAVLDHWYDLFMAVIPLGVVCIAAVALLGDQPKGYVQRVALGILGFLLFGVCLGHLAYFANSAFFRPLLLLVLIATALNDVFAYVVGKALGRRKLCPQTSPNKTVAGAVGALALSTLAVVLFARPLLDAAPGLTLLHLVIGGALLSVCGQLGDLMLSAIKRDTGIKDTGSLIPGHGGVLDRIDSLLLTAPACFHFIGYYAGFGLDQQTRILTG